MSATPTTPLQQHVLYSEIAAAMTDAELGDALVNNLWLRTVPGTPAQALIAEAIERLNPTPPE